MKFVSTQPKNVIWKFTVDVKPIRTYGPKPSAALRYTRLQFYAKRNGTQLDDGRCSRNWDMGELYGHFPTSRGIPFKYFHESPLDEKYVFGTKCWAGGNSGGNPLVCEEFKNSPEMDIEVEITFKRELDKCSLGDISCQSCVNKVGNNGGDCVVSETGDFGLLGGCYTANLYDQTPSHWYDTHWPWERCKPTDRKVEPYDFLWNSEETRKMCPGCPPTLVPWRSQTIWEDLPNSTSAETEFKYTLQAVDKIRDIRRLRRTFVKGDLDKSFMYSSVARLAARARRIGGARYANVTAFKEYINSILPTGVSVVGEPSTSVTSLQGNTNGMFWDRFGGDMMATSLLSGTCYGGFLKYYREDHQYFGMYFSGKIYGIMFNTSGTPDSPATCMKGTVALGEKLTHKNMECVCETGGVNCPNLFPSYDVIQARLKNESKVPVTLPPSSTGGSNTSPTGGSNTSPTDGSPTAAGDNGEASSAFRLLTNSRLGIVTTVLLALKFL